MDIFAWPLLLALAFYIVNLRSRVALLVLVSRRLKRITLILRMRIFAVQVFESLTKIGTRNEICMFILLLQMLDQLTQSALLLYGWTMKDVNRSICTKA